MGRKCKCQICSKTLDSDKAFKVTKGKRNLYYCDEVEYEIYLSEKQEESKNKEGKYSLRFPRFMVKRLDKEVADY